MKKQNMYYAAGLIDGEGTITLMRQTKRQKKSPVVSVSSTTYELVEFLQDTFGGHIITLAPPKKKHWKQAYHWQVSHNGAMDVLQHITPFLKEPKKRTRAELILAEYKSVTPRNGYYTPELLLAKENFESRFFEII